MSLFYKQNAAARFFVDQMNGKVYEVAGPGLLCISAAILLYYACSPEGKGA